MRILNVLVFVLISAFLNAQGPNKIVVQSCLGLPSAANGTYTKGPLKFGCECYDRDNGVGAIYYDAFDARFIYTNSNTCSDTNMGAPFCVVGKASCNDITRGISCSSCVVMASNPIPTISQWGLIILGICLVIVGAVEVRRRRNQVIM